MTPTGIATVHAQLREWRGTMKLDRAAVYASDLIGREVSRETIRRYEVPEEAPKALDPVLLAALAKVYGHEVTELPLNVLSDLRRIAELVAPAKVRAAIRPGSANPQVGAVILVPEFGRQPEQFAPESEAA